MSVRNISSNSRWPSGSKVNELKALRAHDQVSKSNWVLMTIYDNFLVFS